MRPFKLTRANFPKLWERRIRCYEMEQGQFGAIAPWDCWGCGKTWTEPRYYMTYRQTEWQPAEGITKCGECGEMDPEENHGGNHPFVVTKRQRMTL